MGTLQYDGLVEPWKAELIAARARRMGFRGDEVGDAQQEIIGDVAGFRFDEARSNGAREKAVLQWFIDNRLRTMRRAKARYRARLERVRREPVTELYFPEYDRELDVRAAVAALPERDQAVCLALCEGATKHEIAKRLGCSWHAVDRVIARVRRWFERRGLEPGGTDR